jgi:hypothetical protein
MLDAHAAFMGWDPNDPIHRMGPKFAGKTKRGIMPGDIVLIARRHQKKPDVVAFGVVHGEYEKLRDRDGGSRRNLSPFKKAPDRLPSGIPVIDVLPHNRALVQLHPDRNDAHKKVCKWIYRQLYRPPNRKGGATPESNGKGGVIVIRPKNPQLDYKVQTKRQVIKAKKIEAALVESYAGCLKKKGCTLSAAKYKRLQCDGYEEKRGNLIEAKSSTRREHIRMAVGQLLDYAFQGKERFGEPNKAILLPEKPHPNIEKWLLSLDISIIWCKRGSFLDNANGGFS